MKIRYILGSIILIAITVTSIFLVNDASAKETPFYAYQVYLNGKKIGVIKDKDRLYELINKEQTAIKEKYNVENVYPPSGLEEKKYLTYNDEISDVKTIYNLIKQEETFSIKGYKVSVKNSKDGSKNFNIAVLDKEVFTEAANKFVGVFIDSEQFARYLNGNQKEIVEIGEILETAYFNETITIKEAFLNTNEPIYRDVDELSKYLLFGTTETSKKHVVKSGEDISTIAYDNKLSVEELLIANPEFKNENMLLSAGQELNVDLIQPKLTLVYDKHIVYDEQVFFKTEYVYDNTKYFTYKETTQDGSNGITRITKKVHFENGTENEGGYIADYKEITPAITKIIVRGTKRPDGSIGIYTGNDTWAWPTTTPYYISSPMGYRWGNYHQGIDIAGSGKGSPIYSSAAGTVISITTSEDGYGKHVIIDHHNGYSTLYAHLNSINCKLNQEVNYGQMIGTMGSTGRSTGVHLHFEVRYEGDGNKKLINPVSLFR